jgi:uncharacterized membrane protein
VNGNGNSRYWRFLAAVLGTAIALNVAWALIRQALPLVVILLVVVALIMLWRLRRDGMW